MKKRYETRIDVTPDGEWAWQAWYTPDVDKTPMERIGLGRASLHLATVNATRCILLHREHERLNDEMS